MESQLDTPSELHPVEIEIVTPSPFSLSSPLIQFRDMQEPVPVLRRQLKR
jgi:hypothetical protein